MLALETALDANAEQLLFALRAGRFSDYTVPLKGAILRMFRRVFKENYDTGASRIGGGGFHATPRWAPLKPRTLREKLRLGYGRKNIMRRTDRLYRSLTLNRRTPDGIMKVTKTSLTVGTNVPYAAFHQRGNANLPRRQVVPDPMQKTVGEECRQILRDWIVLGKGA